MMKRSLQGLGLLLVLLTSCTGTLQSNDESDTSSNELVSETSFAESFSTLITEESNSVEVSEDVTIMPLATLEPWLLTLEASSVTHVRYSIQYSGVAPASFVTHKTTTDGTYITNALNNLKNKNVETYDSLNHLLLEPGSAHYTITFMTSGQTYTLNSYGGYASNGTKHYKVGSFLVPDDHIAQITYTFVGKNLTDRIIDKHDTLVGENIINYDDFEFMLSRQVLVDGELSHAPEALAAPAPVNPGPYIYNVLIAGYLELYVYSPTLFGRVTGGVEGIILYDIISDDNFGALFPPERLFLSDVPEFADLPSSPNLITFYSNVEQASDPSELVIIEKTKYVINEEVYSLLIAAIKDIKLNLIPEGAELQPSIVQEGIYIYQGTKVWRVTLEYMTVASGLYSVSNTSTVKTLIRAGLVSAPGTFKLLSKAFLDEDLTAEDIKSIHYYYQDETKPIYPHALPEVIELLIKKTQVHELKLRGVYDASVADVEIIQYLGEYNRHYAVYMTDVHTYYTEAVWEDTIAGETFVYPNGNQIYLWLAAT